MTAVNCRHLFYGASVGWGKSMAIFIDPGLKFLILQAVK